MPSADGFIQLDLFPPVLAVRKVGANCHVAFDGAHYSVPHYLFKSMVFVRASDTFVDILDQYGHCVASHNRSYKKHAYVTVPSHMPVYYLSLADAGAYDGAMFRKWAKNIGENSFRLIDSLLCDTLIEEHAYKSCMAILQLSKKFGRKRLNDACGLALAANRLNFSAVRKFLLEGA